MSVSSRRSRRGSSRKLTPRLLTEREKLIQVTRNMSISTNRGKNSNESINPLSARRSAAAVSSFSSKGLKKSTLSSRSIHSSSHRPQSAPRLRTTTNGAPNNSSNNKIYISDNLSLSSSRRGDKQKNVKKLSRSPTPRSLETNVGTDTLAVEWSINGSNKEHQQENTNRSSSRKGYRVAATQI